MLAGPSRARAAGTRGLARLLLPLLLVAALLSTLAVAKGGKNGSNGGGGGGGGGADKLLREADQHMGSRNLQAAEAALRSALQLSPVLPAALFKLSLLLDATGRTEEAIGHCRRAHTGLVLAAGDEAASADQHMHPSDVYGALGGMLEKHGSVQARAGKRRPARRLLSEAVEALERALELSPPAGGDTLQITAVLAKAEAGLAALSPRSVGAVAAVWAAGAVWSTDEPLLAELDSAGLLAGGDKATIPELEASSPGLEEDEEGVWANFDRRFHRAGGGVGGRQCRHYRSTDLSPRRVKGLSRARVGRGGQQREQKGQEGSRREGRGRRKSRKGAGRGERRREREIGRGRI